MVFLSTSLCKCKSDTLSSLLRLWFVDQKLYRQFEPALVPVMMMVTRSAGLMAHWKEAMSKLFPRCKTW